MPRKARFWNRLDAHDIQSPCFKACHLACCTRSRVRCRLARARHHPRDCATSVRDERFARCRGCESTVNGEEQRCSVSGGAVRSEEHTSELQSLMRTSYAVFCLK